MSPPPALDPQLAAISDTPRRYALGVRVAAALSCGLALMLAACSLNAPQAGDSCRRSTECPAGLGCIRSVCTSDLRSVAAENTVPELMSDPPPASDAGAPAADGG